VRGAGSEEARSGSAPWNLSDLVRRDRADLHPRWFGLWILLNTGRVDVRAFDPFPHGLLTMIVSLEAIFLSTIALSARIA
jgi:hypothetical protein